MVFGELETLARPHLDVTVVVFNDAALTLIELKRAVGQGGNTAVRYGPVDFARIATAAGLMGQVTSDVDSLRAALGAGGRGPRCPCRPDQLPPGHRRHPGRLTAKVRAQRT